MTASAPSASPDQSRSARVDLGAAQPNGECSVPMRELTRASIREAHALKSVLVSVIACIATDDSAVNELALNPPADNMATEIQQLHDLLVECNILAAKIGNSIGGPE